MKRSKQEIRHDVSKLLLGGASFAEPVVARSVSDEAIQPISMGAKFNKFYFGLNNNCNVTCYLRFGPPPKELVLRLRGTKAWEYYNDHAALRLAIYGKYCLRGETFLAGNGTKVCKLEVSDLLKPPPATGSVTLVFSVNAGSVVGWLSIQIGNSSSRLL